MEDNRWWVEFYVRPLGERNTGNINRSEGMSADDVPNKDKWFFLWKSYVHNGPYIGVVFRTPRPSVGMYGVVLFGRF